MIVTLYLISANVYNSVDAPHARGFSFIEIWMIGTQIPILLALCEYGFVLFLKKTVKKLNDQGLMRANESQSKLDYNSCQGILLMIIVLNYINKQ